MRLIVNTGFALLTTVLYGLVAAVILWSAMYKDGYVPNEAQTTLYGLTSGAVVAFMLAQLGLAAGDTESGASALRAAVSGDPLKGRGDLILGFVALIFVIVGLWSVMLWVIPDMLAESDSADTASKAASEFIALQAKAFIGIVIAGFAALASSLKSS